MRGVGLKKRKPLFQWIFVRMNVFTYNRHFTKATYLNDMFTLYLYIMETFSNALLLNDYAAARGYPGKRNVARLSNNTQFAVCLMPTFNG